MLFGLLHFFRPKKSRNFWWFSPRHNDGTEEVLNIRNYGALHSTTNNRRRKRSRRVRALMSRWDLSFFRKIIPATEKSDKIINKFEIVGIPHTERKRGASTPILLPIDEGATLEKSCECCPISRSGHRIFASEDFIYLLGGFNPDADRFTFTDVWRFNLATERWQNCSMIYEDLPNCLASFSLIQTTANQAFLFGGTGVPFGVAASNLLHKICVESNGAVSLKLQNLCGDQSNLPPKVYGHAMAYNRVFDGVASEFKEIIYLVGGTTGHIYNMDVWQLYNMPSMGDQWACEILTNSTNNNEMGRYRLEMILRDGVLITFGGGDPQFCAEFKKLLCFDVTQRKFFGMETVADHEYGFPTARKCHAIVEFEDHVYVIGGCRENHSPADAEFANDRVVLSDVWRLHLTTNVWRKMDTTLPMPAFFHSAAVTPEGCIYVFGGCTDAGSRHRSNHLQRMWVKPPPLKQLAMRVVLATRRSLEADGARFSKPRDVILRLVANAC